MVGDRYPAFGGTVLQMSSQNLICFCPVTEQISLCVRYVGVDSDEEMCVNESFLGFAEANSTTGEELATTIMTKLREYGIVTQAMRGQGYDGAANMAGKFSGVRTRIQTEIPEVYYIHCYAHCLNLAVVKSCQLPIVRNTIDTVKDVSYAFHYSSKRTGRFKTMLQQADEEQLDALDGRRKIKDWCETRWSSRADALNIFKSAHALIIDDLGTGGDRNAKQLKLALQDFGFMVALVATECVFQYSLAFNVVEQRIVYWSSPVFFWCISRHIVSVLLPTSCPRFARQYILLFGKLCYVLVQLLPDIVILSNFSKA
jgi:hypothetical protein